MTTGYDGLAAANMVLDYGDGQARTVTKLALQKTRSVPRTTTAKYNGESQRQKQATQRRRAEHVGVTKR